MEIAIVLTLLAIAIILFITEIIPIDVITVLLLIALISFNIITKEEAFSGFGNTFIIMLASIFVIGAAIEKSEIFNSVSSQLVNKLGKNPIVILSTLMIFTALLSAFMNNTSITAMLIAPVLAVSKKINISASKFLMPVAFSAMLGGTCTLIGTSANIAGSAYLENAGMAPLSMFELLPLGIAVCIVGIIYLMLTSRYLIPSYRSIHDVGEIKRRYLSEVIIKPDSRLIGKKVKNSEFKTLNLEIVRVIRGINDLIIEDDLIQANDHILILGTIDDLLKIKDHYFIDIIGENKTKIKNQKENEDRHIAEILINRNSSLRGKYVKNVNFYQHWNLTVLGVYRFGERVAKKIEDVVLRMGDILFVQGTNKDITRFITEDDTILINQAPKNINFKNHGWTVLFLFIIGIILSVFGITSVSVAFMGVAAITVIIKAIRIEDAYRAVDWRLLILIGGMTAFGVAMKKSGSDIFLANLIVNKFSAYGPHVIMGAFMVLTVLITQPLSNAAAALVMLPIAITTAHTLGVNERSFAIAIIVSASISMVTPFEPACILVYGPGKYKFSDFVKVGGFLTLILLAVIWYIIPSILGL